MNTDSILRSYYNVSSSMFVPFAAVEVAGLASDLLSGETQGFAIDATTYDEATDAVYVGGPVGGTVAVIDTGTPANNLSDVALDSSNLVNSGTSPKMVHFLDSPYVRWSPHNFIIRSQTLDHADWSKSNVTVTPDSTTAPDGTSTADTLTPSTNGADRRILRSTNTVSGPVCMFSAYLKAGVATWAALLVGSDYQYFNLGTGALGGGGGAGGGGSPTITSVGNGWYRCTLGFVSDGTQSGNIYIANGDFDNNVTTSQTLFAWGAQVNRGLTATPYLPTTTAAHIGIPQAYDVAAEQYEILAEPAATNEALNSQDFSIVGGGGTIGTNNNCTINTTATTAPDGSATGNSIAADGTNAIHFCDKGYGGSSTATATGSVYVKNNNAGYCFVSTLDGNAGVGYSIIVNLSDGSVTDTHTQGSISSASSSVTDIGNGWYRVAVRTTFTGAVAATIAVGPVITSTVTWAAYYPPAFSSSAGIYAWGMQRETGTVASSYIPTISASATRATDLVTVATSSFPWSATEGTLYADMMTDVLGAFTSIIEICGASDATERITIYNDSGNVFQWTVEDDGTQVNASIGTVTLGRHQISTAFKLNDFGFSEDGAAVSGARSDTTGTMPTVNQMNIGANYAPTTLRTKLLRLVYVPRRVVDGTLPTWRYNF